MSYRTSMQHATACLLSFICRPQAWLLIALLTLSPNAARAACGTMNVPDAYTTPSTSPMASGTSITIDASRCDAFGLNPYPDTVGPNLSSPPSHGTVSVYAPSGAITYVNNGDGATSDSFVLTDASDVPFTVNVAIASATSPLTVSPAALSNPAVSVAYSQQLSTTGGTAPYAYSLAAGSLPPGLVLSGGGLVSGTPTGASNYNFTVHVQDSAGTPATVDKTYSVNVAAPVLDLAPDSPPNGVINQPYSQQFSVSGGTAPYTYSIQAGLGSPPPGMTLSSSGLLSGTPTATGSYTFSLRYDDSTTSSQGPGVQYFAAQDVTVTIDAVPPPTVTSLTPTSGPYAGGTTVTITGTNFNGATAVKFGATNATYTINSNTQITATSPAGSIGTVDVTVTTPGGTSATSANDQYTYVAAPTVTSVSPSNGPPTGGTPVVITGTNFGGATAVTFGGTAATTFTVNSATLIIATSPAGSGTVDVRVTTVGGTSATSAADQYTYVPAPTVASVSPNNGTPAGGTPVTITGTNFNNVTAVSFGGTAAASFIVNNSTSVTAISPAGTGTVDIRVTTAGGTSATSAADQYTFVAAPVANNVSATVAYGSSSNPITLNITGGAPTSVAIAGAAAHGTAVASGTSISYTPTAGYGGPDSFTYTATNAFGTSAPATVTITVSGATISYAPADPPAGTAGLAYSQSLAGASGGTAPYTYAITSGSLPAGITLASNGTLSGTPTVSGAFDFTVTATDSSTGTGPFSATSATLTLTVNAVAPGAPTIGTATAGDAQASVSFTAPASNGGSAITSYTVTSSPGGLTGTCASSPCVVTGLTNGTAYTFTVVATNSAGPGSPSAASNSVTPKGTQTITFNNPGTQNFGTTPTLSASASSTLLVTFTSQTTSVCTITSGGALTFMTAGTCTIAADQAGNGTYLAAPTVTQSFTVAAVAPGAPTIGTATAGNAQASVTFTAPANSGGAAVSSYTVTSSPGGITASGSASPITVTGLTNGTAYTFTATASNTAGPGAPSAASNSVTPQGTQTITFNNPGSQNFGTSPTLVATASSSLPVTFTSSTTSVCTVSPSGTLTSVSPGTCTIQADQAGNGTWLAAAPVQQSFTIVVPGGAVSFAVGSTLPTATGEAPYSFTITAVGGATPYTFSQTGGTLPSGMSFSPAGVLSGTPLASGTFNFTVHVVDAATQTADQTFQLIVDAPAISLSPTSLPSGTGGQAYAQNLSATGGVAPYSYAVTGALPAGVAFSPTGAFSGTPTVSGSFNITVTVTDQHGFQGTQAYTLTVNAPTVAITPATLPNGTGGQAYSQNLSASGGTGPYTYAVTTGTLPAGVTLSSAGALSGTPTVSGSFNITVTATDQYGFQGTQAYTLAIDAPAIAIAPATLPGGTVGQAYSQSLSASGGTSPYTYAVTAGTLPAGLSLSPTGTLSGTPTAAGSVTATVTVTDQHGFQGTQNYTFGVVQPAPVAVNDTASVNANAHVTIAVTANDSGPITSIAITQAPAHGTATVSGLNVLYTPAHDYFGNDAFKYTASGPGGTSAAATVSVTVIPGTVPVAAPQHATVLAGKSVTIHAAANAANGPFTDATVVKAPTSGTATVQGTDIVYTANADASGTVGFDYTLSNAFGASQPAHVVVTVNPLPVAPALTAKAIAGTTVQVDLTAEARGGPFTDAGVVSISPANAGSAAIKSSGDGGYTLAFTSAATFGGVARITYTLSNAFATSAPGTVDVTVEQRSDPSKDAEVLGVLEAQAEAARRMAMGQIGNFQRRLESLHGGGSRAGFTNGITMSSASRQRRLDTLSGMQQQVMGGGGDPFLAPADAPATDSAASGGNAPDGIAFWTGGAMNFGKLQPGTSHDGIDFTTSGLSLGADKQVTHSLTLGLGAGYGHDASDIGQHGSRSTVDSYNVAAYGSYQPGDSAYVDALAGYQWLQFDARRFVTDNGNTVRGSRDGKQWFASLSVGYRQQTDDMLITPYGRLDLARATLDGYTETGDAVFALSYQGQTVRTSTGTLGLLAQWTVKRDYGVWAPQLRAEFGHDMQGSSQATMRYADLPSGPLYQATLARQSRNHTLLGAGIALQTLKGWSLRAEYQNQLDNTSRDNQSILLSVKKTLPP